MATPLFLIGAGFNADAGAEVGSSESHRYPLLSNLSSLFPDFDPTHHSIEDCFSEAIQAHNRKPQEALCDWLMGADFYVASQLRAGEQRVDNAYLAFLNHFLNASFLTFNYDSLLEILLFSLKRWLPEGGYGVPIRSPSQDVAELPLQSQTLVLHLHGSLCIYPQDFAMIPSGHGPLLTLTQREQPDFVFDPSEIGGLFPGYECNDSKLDYRYLDERIIAPVPNKALGLTRSFVRSVYDRAREILKRTTTVVVIGYSFSSHDRNSYCPDAHRSCRSRWSRARSPRKAAAPASRVCRGQPSSRPGRPT